MTGLSPEDPRFERAVRGAVKRLMPWVAARIGDDVAQEIRIALWQEGGEYPARIAFRTRSQETRRALGRERYKHTEKYRRFVNGPQKWGFLRMELLEGAGPPLDEFPEEGSRLPDPMLERAVSAALERLSERDRELIRLRYWEDLATKEICKRVGLSEAHCYALLSRAQKHFRKAFKELAQ